MQLIFDIKTPAIPFTEEAFQKAIDNISDGERLICISSLESEIRDLDTDDLLASNIYQTGTPLVFDAKEVEFGSDDMFGGIEMSSASDSSGGFDVGGGDDD